MTQLNTPTRATRPAVFEVYLKPATGSDAPEGGAIESASTGDNGWFREERLAFVRATYRACPGNSSAVLKYVPIGGVLDPFEFSLWSGQVDDQVRVVMYPRYAGTSFAPDITGTENGLLIFDGNIARNAFGARGDDGNGEDEGGSVILVDAPTMDNRRPEHLVNGRWVNDHPTGGVTPVLVDGLSVPSVFNAQGKPNQGDPYVVEAESGELTNVTASLFTADGDPRARYWTLKEALAHLIVCWFFGIKDTYRGDAQGALRRSSTLDPDTYNAIFGPTTEDPRFVGLDKIIPEVNVHGLGVYDAIERVCRAAGFLCANQLPMGRLPDDEATAPDRLHLLRVWRAGAGKENELRLTAREFTDPAATAEQELADNTLTKISGKRDASRIVNTIIATGRTLVEVTVPLKPLWRPSDVDDLGGETISSRQHTVPKGQQGDAYHDRHVADGREFNQYGHVGRLWGLDETGIFYANNLGYTEGPYVHDQGGFDWLGFLGVDGGEEDGLSAARVANGVTEPIRSTRRTRKPLRLSRPEFVARGQSYILRVSEDAGATWHELPGSAARLLTEGYFGVMLTARNLAMVNRKTFGEASENAVAIPGESWWALFNSEDLRFDLTVLVEMDHAARFDAPLDAGSISQYPRAKRLDTSIIEVWQSPSSILGNDSWDRLDDGGTITSTVGGDRTENLKDLAERTRDELSQVQHSVTIEEAIRLDPSMYQVGDQITGIAGRNVDFSNFAAGAGETTYPSVIAMTITGLPEKAQRINVDIGSESMRRGA